MRTNIVIEDRLMRAAMRAAGTRTKRETVELGLKMVAEEGSRRHAYAKLLAAAGSGGFAPGYDVRAVRRKNRPVV